jgi:hypothetical protein
MTMRDDARQRIPVYGREDVNRLLSMSEKKEEK